MEKAHRMRQDYKPRKSGGVDLQDQKGDKGVPPGMPRSSEPPVKKGVCDQQAMGDKGVVPMKASPKAEAPKD